MHVIYNLFIYIYLSGIYFASFFNKKAKLWISGRHNIFSKIESSVVGNEKLAWFHCASLGEFEQAKPVIEEFRNRNKEFKILLTFFSPSGYEMRNNYDNADYVFYLPIDSLRNSIRFIELVQPDIVFFVKYEFWYNYITQLFLKNIPVVLFSSIFRKDQVFFRAWGKWNRKILFYYKHIFVQNTESAELLNSIGIENVSVAGDTRFDRVKEIANADYSNSIIEKFIGSSKIIIGGSTWHPDEEILKQYFDQTKDDVKLIIAPHEIHLQNISRLLMLFGENSFCYSDAEKVNPNSKRVLIIDNIGLLSHIYKYGTIAFVGGGFKTGLHNVLEPASHGKPIIIGPEYRKFQEAVLLVKQGAAFSVNNFLEFETHANNLLFNRDFYDMSSLKATDFVDNNLGSTSFILDKSSQFLI